MQKDFYFIGLLLLVITVPVFSGQGDVSPRSELEDLSSDEEDRPLIKPPTQKQTLSFQEWFCATFCCCAERKKHEVLGIRSQLKDNN